MWATRKKGTPPPILNNHRGHPIYSLRHTPHHSGADGWYEFGGVLNFFLRPWRERYKGVYKHPRALYTKQTPTLIYSLATVKLGGKQMSALKKVKGKDGLTYTVDTTVTFKKRNKFAQMDLVQLGD